MADTLSDMFVRRLIAWGVDTVFGLPGDGINGMMEAFRRTRDRIRFVHVRHEEAAAFAACGYAKLTGRLGVCVATTGPGALHLLNGLYDAKLDGAPVLAVTGLTYHDLIGTHYQQDLDTDRIFADVALFSQRVMGPAHVGPLTDHAVRTAQTYHGVSHLTFPIDLQEMEAESDKPSRPNVPGHTNVIYQTPVRVPLASDVEQAASLFQGKKRPVIVAGSGARGAGVELEEAAEKMGAPIIKALLGKDVVPDDSPYTTGGMGLLGTRPSQEALENCDAMLMVCTSFPYIDYLPKPGQAVAVQIDTDPARIGLRYPVHIGLVADAIPTVRQILPLLPYNEDRSFLEEARAGMRDWWSLMEERGRRKDVPMKPQVAALALSRLLRDDAVVCTDVGTITTWAARQVQIRRGQRFLVSGTLASMGCALPYAIAAQVAFPSRQCVAIVGDGGMSMMLGDFATCVQERLPVKVVVFNNRSLGMIKWEQMVFLGNPEYKVDLSPINFARVAEACGATGIRVEDPAQCSYYLDQALRTEGPVIVDAVVDPYEAPLPPKIEPEQAVKMAQALLRGQPNRQRIGLTLFRNVVDEALYAASPAGVVGRLIGGSNIKDEDAHPGREQPSL